MKPPQISKSGLRKSSQIIGDIKKDIPSFPPVPKSGLLRLFQIIGDPKRGIPPLIPVSKSTWWSGVKSGRFPKPIKISERCTAWSAEEVWALTEDATV
jgi:prophage regulatory protein